MRETAGTLLFKRGKKGVNVLLVRADKNSRWSIPKGAIDPDESAEDAARRETLEETCIDPVALVPIGYVTYKSRRKRLHCFVGHVDKTVKPQPDAEIRQAKFVPLFQARKIVEPEQLPFLDWLSMIA